MLERGGEELLRKRLDECLAESAKQYMEPRDEQGRPFIQNIYYLQALTEVHIYLKIEHKFTPREVNDLLKFKDPLNVAMNCWEDNPDRFCIDISRILLEPKAFEHFPLAQSKKTPKEKVSIRAQLNEAKRTVQQQLKSGKHISNDAHSR